MFAARSRLSTSVTLDAVGSKGGGWAVVLAIASGCSGGGSGDTTDTEGSGTAVDTQQTPDDGTSSATQGTGGGPTDATSDASGDDETGRDTSGETGPGESTDSSGVATTGGGADEPVCGNGVLKVGEECDDGNRKGGDACSPGCGDPCRELGSVETFGRPSVIVPMDFNGDDQLDLFLGHSAGSAYSLLSGDGLGGFEVVGVPGGGTHIAGVGGDFDSDGQTEIVRSMLGSGNGLYDVGPKQITLFSELDVLAGYSYGMAAGDVEADGDLDVVATGGAGLLVLAGDGAAGFTVSVGPGELGIRHIALADLDGDGDLDAVATEASVANVVVFEYDSGTYIQQGAPWPFALSWVSLADVDGDGSADLIGPAPGEQEAVRIAMGTGDMSFGATEEVATSGIPSRTAVADVNDDGSPDIVLTSSQGVEVLLGDGAGGFPYRLALPRPDGQQGLALADVDGDGVLEIISGSTGGTPGILVVACTPVR